MPRLVWVAGMTNSSVTASLSGLKLAFTCSAGVGGGDGVGGGGGGAAGYPAYDSSTVPVPLLLRSTSPKPWGAGEAVAGRPLRSIVAWLVNVAALHCTSITGCVVASWWLSSPATKPAGDRPRRPPPAAIGSKRRKSAAVTLSCSVNMSPIGQSRVPAGWPLALNTGWGGAAAPNGAAVTCMTEAPVTDGEPIAVVSSAAYSVGATAGCIAEMSRGTASEPAPEHRLRGPRQLVGRRGHGRGWLAETAGQQIVDRGRRVWGRRTRRRRGREPPAGHRRRLQRHVGHLGGVVHGRGGDDDAVLAACAGARGAGQLQQDHVVGRQLRGGADRRRVTSCSAAAAAWTSVPAGSSSAARRAPRPTRKSAAAGRDRAPTGTAAPG